LIRLLCFINQPEEYMTPIYTISILFIVLTGLFAQNRPSLSITPVQGEIQIDGNLDDTGWETASESSQFYETYPGDGTAPPVGTKVKLSYDRDFLYIAFLCLDDDPAKIRSSLCDRDQIWQDDYIGVLLDTYGDANLGIYLFSNPLGIQGDTRFSPSHGEDDSFDLIFDTEAKITNEGYQVEMRIPFSSLPFPDRDVQNWRVNFWRTRPRESRATYSWSRLSRDESCFLCQYGYLNGLQGIESSTSLEFIPSLVASQSASLADPGNPDSKFSHSDLNAEVSLSTKWNISPSLSLEAALNPDFSQVESDAARIDVNQTFALSYPEKRPFFQAGGNLFSTWIDVVYTRAVNNPLAAAKLLGRRGNSSLAFLTAIDEDTPVLLPFEESTGFVALGKSYSNILRYKYAFGESSYLGAMISDRRFEKKGGGTNLGLDGIWKINNNLQIEGQMVFSHSTEPDDTSRTRPYNSILIDDRHTAGFDGETYNGNADYLSLERSARKYSFDMDAWWTGKTFRAENGFITQSSNQRLMFWNGYNFYFENNPVIERIRPEFNLARIWNMDSRVKDEWFMPGLFFRFKNQTSVQVAWLLDNEYYKGRSYDGINRFSLSVDSDFSRMLSFGFFWQNGRSIANRRDDHPVKGKGNYMEVALAIKPIDRIVIQPELQFSDMYRLDSGEQVYSGYILRVHNNLQFNRETSLRLIVQYDQFDHFLDIEPLLSYKLNPFSIFYLGASSGLQRYTQNQSEPYFDQTGWQEQSRQYFLKFQYLFGI